MTNSAEITIVDSEARVVTIKLEDMDTLSLKLMDEASIRVVELLAQVVGHEEDEVE